MLAEIVLPAGTDRVYFKDMPELIAKAAQPDIPEDTPGKVVEIRKKPLTELAKDICGRGRRSLPLTEDDTLALEQGCWKTLPPLSLPTDKENWQPYLEAFNKEPTTRDWALFARITNPHFNRRFLQILIGQDWEKNISDAVLRNELVPQDPTTLSYRPNARGDLLFKCFVSVPEFKEFAARFKIGVRVAEALNSLASPTKPDQFKPSQAPQSLESIRGRGTVKWNHFSREAKKPNWNEWRHTPNVCLFEACALSMDIDPHSLTTTGNDWMVGYPTLSTYADKCFLDQGTKDEFHLRQRLLWKNLPNDNYFPSAVIHEKNPGVSTIPLREFAAWTPSGVCVWCWWA